MKHGHYPRLEITLQVKNNRKNPHRIGLCSVVEELWYTSI